MMNEGVTRSRGQERRAARRYKARHVARLQFVTLLADLREVDGTGLWPTIICQTLDVSERGLTLLVPALREDDDNFFGVKGPVLVTLALPAGAVSVKATAVRYERGGAGAGEFLVCVEVTETEGATAERWVSHVRRCVAAPAEGAF